MIRFFLGALFAVGLTTSANAVMIDGDDVGTVQNTGGTLVPVSTGFVESIYDLETDDGLLPAGPVDVIARSAGVGGPVEFILEFVDAGNLPAAFGDENTPAVVTVPADLFALQPLEVLVQATLPQGATQSGALVFEAVVTPLPAAALLFAPALAGLGIARYRRRKAA